MQILLDSAKVILSGCKDIGIKNKFCNGFIKLLVQSLIAVLPTAIEFRFFKDKSSLGSKYDIFLLNIWTYRDKNASDESHDHMEGL